MSVVRVRKTPVGEWGVAVEDRLRACPKLLLGHPERVSSVRTLRENIKIMKRPLAKPAKESYRRKLPHLQREDKVYFITFVTHNRWILPKSVRDLVIKHCLNDHGNKIYLHGIVVMPDHVHMIVTSLKDDQGGTYGLAEIMQGIKGASARSINKALGREGKVWQKEYFDRILRSYEHAQSKVQYICENPVRKGLVKKVDDYPWLWRAWVEGEK